jgi:hypothetical protein
MLRKIGVVLSNAASRMEQRKEKSRAIPRYVNSNPINTKIHFLGNQNPYFLLLVINLCIGRIGFPDRIGGSDGITLPAAGLNNSSGTCSVDSLVLKPYIVLPI